MLLEGYMDDLYHVFSISFWLTELYILGYIQYIQSKACFVIHVINLGRDTMTLKLITALVTVLGIDN